MTLTERVDASEGGIFGQGTCLCTRSHSTCFTFLNLVIPLKKHTRRVVIGNLHEGIFYSSEIKIGSSSSLTGSTSVVDSAIATGPLPSAGSGSTRVLLMAGSPGFDFEDLPPLIFVRYWSGVLSSA